MLIQVFGGHFMKGLDEHKFHSQGRTSKLQWVKIRLSHINADGHILILDNNTATMTGEGLA